MRRLDDCDDELECIDTHDPNFANPRVCTVHCRAPEDCKPYEGAGAVCAQDGTVVNGPVPAGVASCVLAVTG